MRKYAVSIALVMGMMLAAAVPVLVVRLWPRNGDIATTSPAAAEAPSARNPNALGRAVVTFEETPDQLQALKEIKQDLQKKKPMDRIVCGDVGFGKTEIALRTMAIVAGSGFQSAMLSPTTILANQHFQNFKKRLKGLPFKVALLSRFQSQREQQKIENTLLELGRTAWSQNIKVPSSESLSKQILSLEEQIGELREEKKESISKIVELNKDFERFKKKQDENEQEVKKKIAPKLQDIQDIRGKEKEIESKITQKHFVIEETAKKITQSKKELLELENNAEMNEEEKKSKTKNLEDNIKEWQEKKKNRRRRKV